MNDLSLKQIECFLEVCRDFHFTNAAKRLNISQPPLSRHISELESTLGSKLFRRSGKRIELTEAGRLFLEETFQVPSILARAKDAVRRSSEGETRRIRIGFVGALFGDQLRQLFARFRDRHQDTQLALFDLNPSELINTLTERQIDGAFLGLRPKRIPAGCGWIDWKTDSLRVVVNVNHPLSGKRSIQPSQLVSNTLITLSESIAPAFRKKLERLFRVDKSKIATINETTGIPSILGMLAVDSGYSILPRSSLTQLDSALRSIKLNSGEASLHEGFLYRCDSNNEAFENFVEIL